MSKSSIIIVSRLSFIGIILVILSNFHWLLQVIDINNNIDGSSFSPPIRDVKKSVHFIPFPHKSLGSGDDVSCTWETKSVNNTDKLLYDAIQLAAFEEGMCIPKKLNSTTTMHVFSTSEAIECLSPIKQKRNISLTIAGDSYTRQLFIGLSDILLARPSKNETKNHLYRLHMINVSNIELADLFNKWGGGFPSVQYRCFDECYGYGLNGLNFSQVCSTCMNEYTSTQNDSIGVVGAGVHILKDKGNRVREKVEPSASAKDIQIPEAVNATIYELNRFFDMAKQTIYISMPSYQIEKVPLPYINASHNTFAGQIHETLLPNLAPNVRHHPFIDVFQLTRACNWKNCSYDGGHRSRFVNRWKAQLLLNTLCEVKHV